MQPERENYFILAFIAGADSNYLNRGNTATRKLYTVGHLLNKG